MDKPPAFSHAVTLLAHPLSLSALALALANDFVLRPLAPSALTGKLSDFALLFILPFVGIALFPIVFGREFRMSQRCSVPFSFFFTGVSFATLKLWPVAAAGLVSASVRAGFPMRMVADPSDLLALLALYPAWRLWQRSALPPKPLRAPAAPLRILALLAALLVTLADAAAPDQGIVCITTNSGELRALSSRVGFTAYRSPDGGLTWEEVQQRDNDVCETRSPDNPVPMANPDDPVRYRFTAGVWIERSPNRGEDGTWQPDYILQPVSEAQRAYYEKITPDSVFIAPGPLDGVQDPTSKNIIFAMGRQGVLTRTPDGAYHWAAVGSYEPIPAQKVPFSGLLTLLSGELFLAILAAANTFSTLLVRWHHRRWTRIAKVVLGWAGWLVAVLLVPPALTNGPYGFTIIVFGHLILGLWALGCVIDDLLMIQRAHPPQVSIAGWAALRALVFFPLPYLFWAAETGLSYHGAADLAVLLIGISLGFSLYHSRQARSA